MAGAVAVVAGAVAAVADAVAAVPWCSTGDGVDDAVVVAAVAEVVPAEDVPAVFTDFFFLDISGLHNWTAGNELYPYWQLGLTFISSILIEFGPALMCSCAEMGRMLRFWCERRKEGLFKMKDKVSYK